MKCCSEDKGNQKGNHNHSPFKHMLHMLLCCGLPIAIIGLLPIISRYSPGASRILGFIAPFICPIMMVGMVFMMSVGNKKSSCCDNAEDNANEQITK